MSASRKLLVSLHSRHAERIYTGDKTSEFRRVAVKVATPGVLYIYETAPVRKITGMAEIAGVTTGIPSEIIRYEADPVERDRLRRYLSGAARASAIHLTNVRRFDEPMELTSLGLTRPPQSYCRLV